MSTFVDVLFETNPGITPFLPRMAQSQSDRKVVTESVMLSRSLFFRGNLNYEELFHEFHHDGLSIWILGEIYSYKNARLRNSRQTVLNFVTQDFQNNNFDPVQCNGHFVIISLDRTKDEWKVFTDRLGTYHIYYGSKGGRTAIGTFYKSVVRSISAGNLNMKALLPYFGFGFFWDDETFFEEVVLLQPASVYHFDGNLKKLKQEVYWKPMYRLSPRNYNETIDAFATCLNEVTADLTASGRIAIPISGGLDSRTMAGACTLNSLRDRPYWSYSYGYSKDSGETTIAAKIARARSLPFKAFTIGPYLFDKIDLIVNSVELFQYVDGTRQADITEELGSHADFVVAAHWGDVWLDNSGVDAKMDSGALVEIAMKKFKKRGSDWLIQNLLNVAGETATNQLEMRITSSLQALSAIEDCDFRLKMLKTSTWSHRWTLASIRMFQPGAFPRLPFYDNRMVDFFSSVPSSFVEGRKLQIDYLKRYHPDLAAVTWEEFGANLYNYKLFNRRMLPYRVVSKLNRVVRGKRKITRNWELLYMNDDGRANLESSILDNGDLQKFISRDRSEGLIKQFYLHPDAANGYSISMLHTFALFLASCRDNS